MLLAPFTLSDTPIRRRALNRIESLPLPLWLQIWAIGGILATGLFPFLRGGEMTGMSLPFWLIVAPLLDIAWLARSRWWAWLRAANSRFNRRRGSQRRRIH